MKITDVGTVLLTGPSTNDRFLVEARKRRSAAFIEIHTDTEFVGIGETYAGYFCPETVPSIVDFFRPILVGQSPEDIDVRGRGCTAAANSGAASDSEERSRLLLDHTAIGRSTRCCVS